MSTQINPQEGRDQNFIAYLQRLANQRGGEGHKSAEARAALAALRRGLGKEHGEAPEMYRYVVLWTQNVSPARENAYYLVAALFASHLLSWPEASNEDGPHRTNLGASVAHLAAESGSDSVEKRFMAILNSSREDLPSHLRHMVMLLKSHEIAIDWLRLLRDILNWARDDRRVQRDWARAFWGRVPTTETALGETTAPETANNLPTT